MNLGPAERGLFGSVFDALFGKLKGCLECGASPFFGQIIDAQELIVDLIGEETRLEGAVSPRFELVDANEVLKF